jgi:hypothetical protein
LFDLWTSLNLNHFNSTRFTTIQFTTKYSSTSSRRKTRPYSVCVYMYICVCVCVCVKQLPREQLIIKTDIPTYSLEIQYCLCQKFITNNFEATMSAVMITCRYWQYKWSVIYWTHACTNVYKWSKIIFVISVKAANSFITINETVQLVLELFVKTYVKWFFNSNGSFSVAFILAITNYSLLSLNSRATMGDRWWWHSG